MYQFAFALFVPLLFAYGEERCTVILSQTEIEFSDLQLRDDPAVGLNIIRSLTQLKHFHLPPKMIIETGALSFQGITIHALPFLKPRDQEQNLSLATLQTFTLHELGHLIFDLYASELEVPQNPFPYRRNFQLYYLPFLTSVIDKTLEISHGHYDSADDEQRSKWEEEAINHPDLTVMRKQAAASLKGLNEVPNQFDLKPYEEFAADLYVISELQNPQAIRDALSEGRNDPQYAGRDFTRSNDSSGWENSYAHETLDPARTEVWRIFQSELMGPSRELTLSMIYKVIVTEISDRNLDPSAHKIPFKEMNDRLSEKLVKLKL